LYFDVEPKSVREDLYDFDKEFQRLLDFLPSGLVKLGNGGNGKIWGNRWGTKQETGGEKPGNSWETQGELRLRSILFASRCSHQRVDEDTLTLFKTSTVGLRRFHRLGNTG
jgi:hypothetical protein